jgi:acyl dehydratase
MVVFEGEKPPEPSLTAIFLKRGSGGNIPRLEARASRLVGNPKNYAAVCGFAEAVPITWPALLSQPLQLAILLSPQFPLSLLGIVHTRQKIIRYRRVEADEVLSACCKVEGYTVVKSGGEFELVTEVKSGEELVWEGVTTILSRQIKGDGVERPRTESPPLKAERSTGWELPATLGKRYAEVSGDYNPIHLSPWTSRWFGFKKPIIHGWWTLARALAEQELPERCEVEAKFVAPISLPGSVIFESSGDGRFEVRGKKGLCLVGECGLLKGQQG